MRMKLLVVILGSLVLTACSSQPSSSTALQAEAYETANANVSLAEAAGSVSESLNQLGATMQSAYPPKSVSQPPSPTSYGMGMTTSIDWNGPIEPIVQQIANATHYQLQVLGAAPSIPVIVSVQAKNTPMGDILRNIGYQGGNKASVVVFPSRHVIELRYANNEMSQQTK